MLLYMRTTKTTVRKSPRKPERVIRSLHSVVQNALAQPHRSGVYTVRLRPSGHSLDRHLTVETSRDPKQPGVVVLRVSPVSAAPLAVMPAVLTTQQVADLLNVSRPYITQLVDQGRFGKVQRTQSGHRRIPLAEVERVQQEIRATRRAALDELPETAHLRKRELREAKAKAKRRWAKSR